ncbi:MAG TPA: NAD(P)-dependent alcohol dehydrogenase [Burkholderiales bacterium]
MLKTKAYAAQTATSALAPWTFERRDVGAHDVLIDVSHCGVCHSDIHQARDGWGGSIFPMVPGHEIIGRVAKVGGDVKKFKAGELVGVGCMVDSCRECAPCKAHLEQYCEKVPAWTYNGTEMDRKTPTFGGYSDQTVVDENYVVRVPDNLDPAAAAPLLCAGITTYSPLRHWKVGKGHKVGIIGLGGLGHMGVKFAAAFGADAWVITTTAGKAEDAKRLGAAGAVVSKNADDMAKHVGSFDFLLNTVAAKYDLAAYLSLLKLDGTMAVVGVPEEPLDLHTFSVIAGRKSLAGSAIGGIAETQEMLDYCGKHNIVSDIETIPIQKINEAYERMLKSDVRYRFTIDMASLKNA